MTPLALYLCVNTVVKYMFIDIQEPEFTFLVYPAETGILVA
jgi:hypothetical protein